MRIIGGDAGGRKIRSPKGSGLRPTPDMIKEAIFNILKDTDGKTFLDLFAGTGSVGIEALSRGASRGVFVEKNTKAAFQIRKILTSFEFGSRAEVLAMDVKQGIAKLCREKEAFDIVFADPPYERDFIAMTVERCTKGRLIVDDGLLVLQHSIREPFAVPPTSNGLVFVQEKRYGDTVVTFLRYNSQEN